ncbi:MAG: PIN domain-containing protein [Spirochaetota bacterium]
MLDFIRYENEYVTAVPLKMPFRDESDKMFLEVAETGGAEFLLTGNKDHFPKRKKIITPAEFFSRYY